MLDYKEGWAPKNWCFWTAVLQKTLESPLDSKEIKAVNPKGNQPWLFIGRTDAEGEAPILWPSDANSQLTGKGPDAGRDWGQEEKGMTEDEMVGRHHWLNGQEFEQTLGEWRTGKPGMLQSMGSQRGGCNWTTEQQRQQLWVLPGAPEDHADCLREDTLAPVTKILFSGLLTWYTVVCIISTFGELLLYFK